MCIIMNYIVYIYIYIYKSMCGPVNSVGIATDYELDGPGSNPGGNEIFRPLTLILLMWSIV